VEGAEEAKEGGESAVDKAKDLLGGLGGMFGK